MARPRLPDEVKERRGTLRNRSDGTCPHLARRIRAAKKMLPRELLDVYLEALERIDADTPHVDGCHGIPNADDLADIELVEKVINPLVPPELELHSADLYRLLERSNQY